MSKSTINRQQLFLEFLSIIFAVLLALLLNSLRESMATERALDRVTESIRAEILKNDSTIRKSMAYRRDLIFELYNDEHLVMSMPVNDLPIDASNDRQLENYLKRILPFAQSTPVTYLKVQSLKENRIISINNRTMTLYLQDDMLLFYGPYNLQLRTADISNRSWEIAKATGTLVEMDLALVDALNNVYTLNNQYLETSDKAIDQIYAGKPSIRSVLEDMYYFETQIVKADSILLTMLNSDEVE
ncbi:MAG: hypothetical protein KI793_36170 [Rivularia sp. (in: Bacteria)]|nr:hypothetical protein [Rivularia sp. MS3]